MSTNNVINIHDDLRQRTIPDYLEKEVLLFLKNDNEYNNWYTNVACSHATWGKKPHDTKRFPGNLQFIGQPLFEPKPILAQYFYCDHYKKGKPRNENEPRQCVTKKISKRAGCGARIINYTMTDNTIKVNYKWEHNGHNPSNFEEIIKSTLPPEIKEWIKQHVEQNFNWTQIKDFLRIDESRLNELEDHPEYACLPKSFFVKYKDVKNLIDARIARLTRKAPNDKESVQLWIELFNQENYYTLLKFHENGPFILSWVSPWQKKFLEEAEEWCVDSTHKTCRSLNNPTESSYLYTIVIKNPVTLKGLPVCYFNTVVNTRHSLHNIIRISYKHSAYTHEIQVQSN